MSTKENQMQQTSKVVEKIVDELTLFDDDLMSMVFDANVPATELVLKIILARNDIKVINVTGQKELKNPVVGGRNLRLDVLAEDEQGQQFNVEVQRKNSGADERRARFHSSMVDSRMLKKKQRFKELPDSYMIMITQNDYFGRSLPVYTVKRHIEELDEKFKDGSHILYVNGSYRGNDPLGRLMQDFSCKNAKDIHYKELADGVRHFKEEGGRKIMCEAVEKYAQKKAKEAAIEVAKKAEKKAKKAKEAAIKATRAAAIKSTIEDAISYGMDRTLIVQKVIQKYGVNKKEAEKLYERYAVTAV